MRRFWTAALVVVGVVGLGVGANVLAKKASQAPASVELDCGPKQPAVKFDHATHVGRAASCTVCHHQDKGLKATDATEVKACRTCHKPDDPMTDDQKKVGKYVCTVMSTSDNAFHKNCIGCHKEKAKGPTKCAECHKKSS